MEGSGDEARRKPRGAGGLSPTSWHALPLADVISRLEANANAGLSAAEARHRIEADGPNTLPEDARQPLWRIVIHQFASPLIYILFAAAGIAMAAGERGDALVILAVVIMNAIIGAVQEGRAERSMEALRRLAAVRVRVKRNGGQQLIDARELVPGDIVLVQAGDAVAADARLIEAASLEAAEAALTGESLPVNKSVGELPAATLLADRSNMIHSGTHIVAGRGVAIVVETGVHTEVGNIATLTQKAAQPKTPLELRLSQFGRFLVVAAVLIFLTVIGVGVWRGLPFFDVLMVAISQMVSLVPEGLPVAMTIALAVGMQRMAHHNAIVRRLAAVETLGSTTVICTDKTGTLTRNEMTVTALWLPDRRCIEVSGVGYAPEGELQCDGRRLRAADDSVLHDLIEAVVLCNDARLAAPDENDSRWRPIGDTTEAALLTLARKAGIDPAALRQRSPRTAEIPFDSRAQMMAVENDIGGQARVFLKGAPEVILEMCRPEGGEHAAERGRLFEETKNAAAGMAANALRVLAAARADGSMDAAAGVGQFRGRAVVLGLVGEMDPPRKEARQAVAQCQSAGIRPIMVTGDHKATGVAIATMLGIAQPHHEALDGRELEEAPAFELEGRLDRITVFARVQPAQKLKIVELLQSRNHVVAMTGDGVNDAPALARADVGVAMGITGTEVARSAARIVLTDDNFSTLVKAVEQGRLVYRNLQKVLLFLFATSVDEVIVLLLALLLGYPLPLAAVQILWINIVTEGTVTVNLIMEGLEGDEMRRPPINRNERLITRTMFERLAVMVPASVLATFGFFVWRLSTGAPFALVQTETFTLLAVCQWYNVLNCRSEKKSAITADILKNPWLLGGLALGIFLHLAVIYAEPLNRIFHTTPIPLRDFLLIAAVGSTVLWAEEIRKWLARRSEKQ
jgi:magnesium-transporting ATPase (P-type)